MGARELLQAGAGMGDWHDTKDYTSYTSTVKGELSDLHLHYFINLRPLIDSGVFTVQQQTSNKRIHSMLRRMGYSHLFVVDQQHRLIGTITRRALITLESKQTAQPQQPQAEDEAGEETEQEQEAGPVEEQEAADAGSSSVSQPLVVSRLADADDEKSAAAEQLPRLADELKAPPLRSTGRSMQLSSARAAHAVEPLSLPHVAVNIAVHTPPGLGRRTTLQRIQMHTKDLK